VVVGDLLEPADVCRIVSGWKSVQAWVVGGFEFIAANGSRQFYFRE
jgi:hypothetical protein